MDIIDVEELERKRLNLQERLNKLKTHEERNRLGQYATPTVLATDMLQYSKSLLPSDAPIRFLDPAFGSGAFFSALLRTFPLKRINSVAGYEIDEIYIQQVMDLWHDFHLELHHADFTRVSPPESEHEKATLLICNPPYVRHHYLSKEDKSWLQARVTRLINIKLSGLSGLYGYFLCLAHQWMADNCLAGWLIPGEFLDVNYGQQIREYLLSHVTVLRIHRFDANDLQFSDALTSSAIVWFRNTLPSAQHEVEFTGGGTLLAPLISRFVSLRSLKSNYKWSTYFRNYTEQWSLFSIEEVTSPILRSNEYHSISTSREYILSDLFEIKRGVATGANKFFILTDEQVQAYGIAQKFLKPVLPGPRFLSVDEIKADAKGMPLLEKVYFLLSCNFTEEFVKKDDILLWKYLQMGKERGIHNGYLCRHRTPWYVQEYRPPAPLLCTYMGRQSRERRSPFRFILNQSCATATNVYLLLYPRPWLQEMLHSQPELMRMIWRYLNAIPVSMLVDGGRTYGDGLHKLEPGELGRIPVSSLVARIIGHVPVGVGGGLI
jgi:adenine-specific DNA-methyltransferase